jgi:hypothetical protein
MSTMRAMVSVPFRKSPMRVVEILELEVLTAGYRGEAARLWATKLEARPFRPGDGGHRPRFRA